MRCHGKFQALNKKIMALPKKGLRKIVVNDIEYVWRVRLIGYDDMNLTIALASNQKRMLQYSTSVVEQYTVLEERADGSQWLKSSGQLNSITSKMVREIILVALKNGWEQAEDGVFPIRNFIFDTASYSVGTPHRTLNLYFLRYFLNFLALNWGIKIARIPLYKGV